MNEERLYRVFAARRDCAAKHECFVEVRAGECILGKAKGALAEKFGRKSYEITEIVEIPKCEGCRLDSCGQRDHMLHPDGCLHDPSLCDSCQMELKELLE